MLFLFLVAEAKADEVAAMFQQMCQIVPEQESEASTIQEEFDEKRFSNINRIRSVTNTEMELIANNPLDISGFLNTPTYYKYAIIYHSLAMVKHDNRPALNEYVRIIRALFEETIRSLCFVNDSMLICKLIETKPALRFIRR